MSGDFGFTHHALRWLLRPWTRRVRTLNASLDEIKELQQKGQVIFVGNAASMIDFIIINDQLKRHGLEPIGFVDGLNPFLTLPLAKAWRLWTGKFIRSVETSRQTELDIVCEKANQGKHGYVFLKKTLVFATERRHYFRGFFARLAKERGDQYEGSTYLVPTSLFLTRMRKTNVKPTPFEILFRSYDVPSRLRKALQLFFNQKKGGSAFSKPIDLTRELAKAREESPEVVEKRIRLTLMLHLNNEDRAYRGPYKRSKEDKVRRILKERRLNEELEKTADRTGRSLDQVRKEAGKTLHEIASDTSERVINLLRILFDFIWSRTLEGIDTRQEDLDRIRELNREGPVVLLPCHRSHVDYLVTAYEFEKKGLNYPRFAAGDNLSKWPLGAILRRAGAFFIRRSFQGEVIFPLVFDAYLRHVLRERHILIFFMEGGRSRTGKLLHPKIGMMSMIIDAWRQGVVRDLPLLPVTIDYGKVFEGQAYLREQSGQEKKKENIGAVIRSRKVLKRKHGVIRLRFGEPIYVSEFVAEKGLDKGPLSMKKRLGLLHDLSYHVLNQINRRVTLTAGNLVAGLLLGNPRRGMALSDLKAQFILAVRFLRRRKVEIAFEEKKLETALANALDTFELWEVLLRVEVGGETVVSIPKPKRSEMEFYKNNGLHFILDLSLFCMGFKCLPPEQRNLEEIHAFAREVFAMLDQEFLYQNDYPTPDMMADCFKALAAINGLTERDGRLVLGASRVGRDMVLINAHLLLNFLESYFVVAESLSRLPEEGLDKKQFLKECMTASKLLYAVGALRRTESQNQINFANALTKFNKLKLVQFRGEKNAKNPTLVLNPKRREAFEKTKASLFRWLNELD